MRINKILVHLICIVLLILIILLIYYNISNKKEHFAGHSNKHKKHHYCAVDGKCVKSIKNCGKNILDIKIDSYPTESICNNYVDKCQKYNYNSKKCLLQSQCGTCTNSKGDLLCLNATPIGPYDLRYKCRPQTGKTNNNFIMGQSNEFVQPDHSDITYGSTLPNIVSDIVL